MTAVADVEPVIVKVPARAVSARNEFLDALRLLAALAVVWIHSFDVRPAPSPQDLGRFAVPFFTVTAIWLMARRPTPKEPFGVASAAWLSFVRRRFVRLYVPFLIWNVVYTAMREIKLRLLHTGGPSTFDVGWFTSGVAMHLWFLPFLFVTQAVSRAVLVLASYARALQWVAALACLAAAPLVGLRPVRTETMGITFFLGVSREALPAALLATSVALMGWHRLPVSTTDCCVRLAFFVLATLAVVWGGRNVCLETLAGLWLAGAAFCPVGARPASPANTVSPAPAAEASPLPRHVIHCLARLGTYAFGIYLVHIVFQNVLLTAIVRRQFAMTDALHVCLFMTIAALSLGFCLLTVCLPGGEAIAKWTGIKSV